KKDLPRCFHHLGISHYNHPEKQCSLYFQNKAPSDCPCYEEMPSHNSYTKSFRLSSAACRDLANLPRDAHTSVSVQQTTKGHCPGNEPSSGNYSGRHDWSRTHQKRTCPGHAEKPQ